ncbi:MAG: sigma-70 family RNA polymerase sigma factor [Planctomycetota bacterium]
MSHHSVPESERAELRGGERAALHRDLDLLRRWRAGDGQAGMALLQHYQRLFYRTCLKFGLRDEDKMMEILQDVVVRLMEGLPALPERVAKSFGGFFYWQVRDAVLKERRRMLSIEPLLDGMAGADQSRALEAWDAVESCWKKLPPRESKVFELRYLHGMSLKETAASLCSNVNAIGQAIFRLSAKMKECLERAGY